MKRRFCNAPKRLAAALACTCAGLIGTATANEETGGLVSMRRDFKPQALRAMVEDLRVSFPDRFPEADRFLGRLAVLEKSLPRVDALLAAKPKPASLDEVQKTLDEALAFQREIALANPVVKAQPILFVVREQYAPDHHNTATLFHTGEPNCSKFAPGGALKFLNPATGLGSVLFDPGDEGLVRDPEVNFDGRRIVFSMRLAKDENYSIYELEVAPEKGFAFDPGSLRRLTAEADASDIDPLYLPDGKILFTSTREPKYCHCNMHIMANLHRMDGDGANIHQISKNTLFDGHPTLLPDGRVLYYRWEYVDRNYGDAQGLWTVNPDGTVHSIYWANNTVSPAAVFDGRAVPGTNLVASIFGSCHDRPWGALALVDRAKGIDSEQAVTRIWPESARELISIDGSELSSPFMVDHFRNSMRERYEDPFPLVDPATGAGGKYFLVSRSIEPLPEKTPHSYQNVQDALNGLQMGLYLVDVFGNEILLHTEEPGCFDPMPLAPRPRPKAIPDRRDYTSPAGTMFVSDVYEGPYMKNVDRGEVAWLRVVESTEKRVWTNPLWVCAQYAREHNGTLKRGNTLNRPAISWAGFETKRILGTVPVEKDGSAHFEVPAEKFVYFQLLDRDKQMISTMRSGTMVQPGERQGCIGCHEDRLTTPLPLMPTLALERAPSKLAASKEPASTFNYLADIQPIWDQHCVECHDFEKETNGGLVLARDKELVFNASYVELFQNWGGPEALLHTVGLGLAPADPAYATGSHRSRLVQILKEGHYDVALSKEETEKIVAWIDIGGPYYPDYACAHPKNVAGRSPLTIPQTRRLEELTSLVFLDSRNDNPSYARHQLWISFDRPEVSPCLKKLNPASEAYREALSIIRAGQEELQRNPEADLPGFVACSEHRKREAKYQRLRARERVRRGAIAEGRKVYDSGIELEEHK